MDLVLKQTEGHHKSTEGHAQQSRLRVHANVIMCGCQAFQKERNSRVCVSLHEAQNLSLLVR